MPTYLDFNTTSGFRDFLIGRTLQQPNGPQTFTDQNYIVQNLSDFSNVDPGAVDTNRTNDLTFIQTQNIFKPTQYFIKESIDTIPRRANLQLYPYFQFPTDHNLIGIMTSNGNYDTESELFKFAAKYIKENRQGPVFARVQQNLEAATIGRARILDALNGNTATALNILTGREPLIEYNNKITVANTAPGKAIDFLQTVAGTEFPFSEIPGDYLTNPANPVEYRPQARTEFGAILQDVTGALGSLIGIQRRPKLSRKPSDIFIEYMGEGQKQYLFNNLGFSKYGPDYTTTARSQQSSKVFNFVNNVAEGVKSILGLEAPSREAYIGDDRSNDVKFAMGDFNDRPVRSNYFLSFMFDEVQAKLSQGDRNTIEGGALSGKLTWISSKSKNKLGEHNKEYADESSKLEESLSTRYGFRGDSILGTTQDLLETMPKDGGAARSHVANVIDQTSRVFREGDMMMSRGSAIKYVDKFSGEETGVEYCRVWTKDRSYMNYSDTMKRTEMIRKFDASVMGGGSKPWNLNIAPMSNGLRDDDFKSSTNIVAGGVKDANGKDFYAKKYMFSIENLAWKSSTLPGFMVQDLPYCERGPNGGRVMWFPPYDLKVSENNSARWEANTFLGRPESIYTYQNTERTGQIGFKIVVDHPSILNLLVRDYFKGMPDDEADNYINAFFAGCEEVDFYGLIRRFTTLDGSDIELIKQYLNKGTDPQTIIKYKTVTDPVTTPNPSDTPTQNSSNETVTLTPTALYYENDFPKGTSLTAGRPYGEEYNEISPKKNDYISRLQNAIVSLVPATSANAKNDKKLLFGSDTVSNISTATGETVTTLTKYFDELSTNYGSYTAKTETLKQDIANNTVKDIELFIESATSSVATQAYNNKLSLRRTHSIIRDFFDRIKTGSTVPDIQWINEDKLNNVINSIDKEYTLEQFGYVGNKGKVTIKTQSYGELYNGGTRSNDCINKDFKYITSPNGGLKVVSPIAFYCRHSIVGFKYTKTTKAPPPPPPPPAELPRTRIDTETSIIPGTKNKPSIDVMKRIIMKTLSECYYFKKLEEDSPLAFKSLREKLKYFHPGFHSTTPEGLNSRLTFLHQCIRPGDTIPIKGVADKNDINARNTSFGPPPVCVLRVGDFYHSKIIIKDVNITFDDNVWDLNPEGIGVQPMIANVQLSVNFIGGQGLERPVERLQNALSSNFYANTEIYDERSISTNSKIAGKDAETFTKEFLEELLKDQGKLVDTQPEDSKNEIKEGEYIGLFESANTTGATIDFTKLIDDVFEKTESYFNGYESMYNTIVLKYGNNLGSIFFSSNYRTIKDYDVYTAVNTPQTIELFGLYPKTSDISIIVRGVKSGMIAISNTVDLCQIFGFDKELTGPKKDKANELLTPYIESFLQTKFDEMIEQNALEDFEKKRDELISALDKVNVIVKYGFYDYKIDGTKVTEATLSGFTYDKLYNEYSKNIEYITNNTPKLYTDLNTSINYNSSNYSTQEFTTVLSVLFNDVKDRDNLMKNTFETDTTIFTENLRKKLRRRLDDFYTKTDDNNFKFSKFKKRGNSKTIKFSVQSTAETSDAGKVQDVKNVKSTKFRGNNKLNFYKNGN